jgi:type II secretory pathway pseudopilin PulG
LIFVLALLGVLAAIAIPRTLAGVDRASAARQFLLHAPRQIEHQMKVICDPAAGESRRG